LASKVHAAEAEQHKENKTWHKEPKAGRREPTGKKEKALRQKTKPVGACEAVQKAARAGENLEEERGKKRTREL